MKLFFDGSIYDDLWFLVQKIYRKMKQNFTKTFNRICNNFHDLQEINLLLKKYFFVIFSNV